MTMLQKTYFTSTFDDLTDAEKAKAMDKYRDINLDSGWWESIYEDASRMGITIRNHNLETMTISGHFFMTVSDVIKMIFRDHGQETETWKLAYNYQLVTFSDMHTTEGHDDFLDNLLNEYLKTLVSESYYRLSDDQVAETLTTMEYQFDLRTMEIDEQRLAYSQFTDHLKRFRNQKYTPEQETA